MVPVLTNGCETLIWREKEGSSIRAVQMGNLRGLVSIRRMDIVQNIRIRQFGGVTKGVNEKIDEGVLWWFGHVERMENGRIAKRVYVGECAGSRSVSKPRKEWLKKRGSDVKQARRMVQDMSE